MHSLYPIADYQYEVERRREEMTAAHNAHLARECPGSQKSEASLPLRLLNFLLLLVPFFRY
jgi:hypothetical protein